MKKTFLFVYIIIIFLLAAMFILSGCQGKYKIITDVALENLLKSQLKISDELTLKNLYEANKNQQQIYINNTVSDLAGISNVKIKKIFFGDIVNEISNFSELRKINTLEHISIRNVESEEIVKNFFIDNVSFEHIKSLEINFSHIKSIEFLSKFPNLESLDLQNNEIEDISPIINCSKVRELKLNNNKIKVLKNVNELRELEYLSIWGNKLSNIDALCSLKSLRGVSIASNEVKRIDPIYNNKNLEYLDFSNNFVSDISGVYKLNNLKYLTLEYNRISNFDSILKLNHLKCVSLANNLFIDNFKIKDTWIDYERYIKPFGVTKNINDNTFVLKLNGTKIRFKHNSIFYNYSAYVEATQFFRAIGGEAKYNLKKGILECSYKNKKIELNDFSNKIVVNGVLLKINNPMLKIQLKYSYVPVEDILNLFDISFKNSKFEEVVSENNFVVNKINESVIRLSDDITNHPVGSMNNYPGMVFILSKDKVNYEKQSNNAFSVVLNIPRETNIMN